MDLENLEPRLCVRNTDFDFAIEAARSPQRGVKNLGNIGRANDDDLAARYETIHQAEELRHNALFDFADHFGALGSHGVDFVDKENRRGMARRFLEDLAELGLALPVKLPHDFGTIEVNEVNAAFGGYGARQQRLTRAWRAVQKHALWSEDSQPLEYARVLQRQLDDFAHARNFTLQAANIFVGYSGSADRRLLAFHDPNVGALPNHDRSRGNRAHDLEIHGLGKSRYAHSAARDDRNALEVLQHLLWCDDRRRGAHPQRREADGHGLVVLDRRYRHLLLQTRAAITAAGAIDLDHAFVSVVRNLYARDSNRPARNLHDVAGSGAQTHQVGWRQPRHGVTDVLDTRLRNAQREGRRSSR